MSIEYTFILEKYKGLKSRHTCPTCNHKQVLARYVDPEGNYIADHVGRCNRESKCGYHLKPSEYFKENPQTSPQPLRRAIPETPKPIEYISPDVLKATLKAYEQNTFVKYLHTLFNSETVQRLIDCYGLGTARDGSCIFWQVDHEGLVRTGKVIRYSKNGHRDKTQSPYFVHKKLGVDNIEQCLYGLHQIIVGHTPIGLVESEKTATIMAGRLSDYTWVATGGKSNLSKVDVLKGRKVVAFPDSDAFNEWSERLAPYGFIVSDALQSQLTSNEQKEGLDLADFVTKAQPYFETLKDGRTIEMHPAGYPLDWN